MENRLYTNLIKNKLEILNSIGEKAIVYQFVNLINGKSYIGSTLNASRRF
jgi:hypothetical protein